MSYGSSELLAQILQRLDHIIELLSKPGETR